MSELDYWQVFTETGEPLCWLMCRAADKKNRLAEAEKEAENVFRSS